MGRYGRYFRTASKAIRAMAAEEFRADEVGKMLEQIETARLHPNNANLRKAKRMLDKMHARTAAASLQAYRGADFQQFTGDILHYARRGRSEHAGIMKFLEELGTTGNVLKSLIFGKDDQGKRSKRQSQLQSLFRFLRALGNEVLPNPKRAKPSDVKRGIESARAFLEAFGYQVIPPGQEAGIQRPTSQLPFGIPAETTTGKPRNSVLLPTERGPQRFPLNHPIVTGEMIRTPQSSNVWAFGYDIEKRTLYVRYQQSHEEGHKGGAGPLYGYYNVPAKVFLSMMSAASKGTFVWDALRIRGTVSGHQYDYALEGIRGTYVPRKATLTPAGEAFIRRTIRVKPHGSRGSAVPSKAGRAPDTARGARFIRSEKPDQLVQAFPNRGTPNRGFPYRGL